MRAKCPACSTLLNIPDHLAGKPVKCQCGKVFKCSPPKKRPAVTQPAKRPAARKSFRITCPKCNKALKVEEKLLGQMVKCPCGVELRTNAAVAKEKPKETYTLTLQQDQDSFSPWDTSSAKSLPVNYPASQIRAQDNDFSNLQSQHQGSETHRKKSGLSIDCWSCSTISEVGPCDHCGGKLHPYFKGLLYCESCKQQWATVACPECGAQNNHKRFVGGSIDQVRTTLAVLGCLGTALAIVVASLFFLLMVNG